MRYVGTAEHALMSPCADAPSAEAVSSFSIRQYWPFAVHAGLSSMVRLAAPAEIVAMG